MLHPISDNINVFLLLEKKKNDSPTTPSNFTKVPTQIKNVAQISFFCSTIVNDNRISAATAILNCDIIRHVIRSCAAYHNINNISYLENLDVRIATYNNMARATCHKTIPNPSGTTAKGAMNKEKNGP